MNKYERWYNNIVEKAKSENRIKTNSSYYESHHIKPKSLGGSNAADNIVLLTYREHFICHWLLTKFVAPEHVRKMQYALSKMIGSTKYVKRSPSSGQYAIARKAVAEAMSGRLVSTSTRKKISTHAKTRTGVKNSFYGKTHSTETLKKLSAPKPWLKGKKRPEHSTKMKQIMKGRIKSDAHRANISKTWYDTHKKVTCKHCHRELITHMHTRWHGDKCKERKHDG